MDLINALKNNDCYERFKAIIDPIIDSYKENSFDDILLSQDYEKNILKGTKFPKSLKVLFETHLIKTRLFEKDENRKVDVSKERKDFLIYLIDELNKHKKSLDGVFVFIARGIATNIHILKKQLKSYDKLPWEEIEFCLVVFIADKINRDSTLISHLLIDREKVLEHLNYFRDALSMEHPITKTKLANKRDEIKSNILSDHPQFNELYDVYETLRDVYSLKRMQWYMNVVLSSENGQMKQNAIERTLQVIGENLKNTLQSPNISSETEKRLLASAPKQLKNILTTLRNMLSHTAVLEKKIFLGENHREDIENDLKKVYVEVGIILYEKLKKVEKVSVANEDVPNVSIYTKEQHKIGEIVAGLKLKHPENAVAYNEYFNLNNKKIVKMQNLRRELRFGEGDLIVNDVDDNETLRKFIESCVIFEKFGNNVREQLLMMTVALEAGLFDLKRINSISDYKEELEKTDDVKKIERICSKIADCLKSDKEKTCFYANLEKLKTLHFAKTKISRGEIHSHDDHQTNINVFPSKVAKILEKLSPEDNLEEIQKTVSKVNDAYQLIKNVAADNVITLKNYRNHLNKFCRTLNVKDGDTIDSLVNDLKSRFDEYFEDRLTQLVKIMDANEPNKNLRAIAIEMLLLDLLEILMSTYNFTDNTSFLDRPTPLLVGKNLRNYLAHGNPLIDTFPFDPRNSIQIHCTLFKENSVNFDKDVNYSQTTNFTLESAKEFYGRRLALIENQAAMFEAASQGNMRKVEECVRNGADPSACDVNGETGLKCAAKANNVEVLMYFLERNVDESVESLLESAAENGCESIVEYLLENNQEARKCMRGDNQLLRLAVLNDKISMVRLLLNSGCKANALHLAALKGSTIIADALINHGASIALKDNLGEQPLHAAARSGSWECAELFLNKGADINAENHERYTALHIAAFYGHAEFISKLLERDASPNTIEKALLLAASNAHAKTIKVLLKQQPQPQGLLTPLHAAAHFGHRHIVELLLGNAASILAKDSNSWAPLHFAAVSGRADLIKLLFHPGLRTDTSATALHLAAYSGSKETVEAVLECKNDVIDSVDEFGCTALYMAAFRGNSEAVKVLLEAGAKTDVLINHRSTALLTATAGGHQKVVELLLSKVSEEELNYALHTATEFNHLDLVKLLLKAGGNPNFEVQTKCTAIEGKLALQKQTDNRLPVETRNCLITAVQKGNIDIVKTLLENGATVNALARYELKTLTTKELNYTFGNFINLQQSTDNDALISSYHCFHIAAMQGHTEIIELLLKDYGVEKDIKDFCGATALFHAACHDHKNAVQALLKAGADPNITDESGQTPLHIVAFRNFAGTAGLLVRHDANVYAKAKNDTSVLEMAVLSEQTDVLEMLLNCVKISFEERYMVLQFGVIHGKAKAVGVLLQKEDPKRFSISLFKLYPPLHNAVHFERKDVLEVLLDCGFEINATFAALTPLHLAVMEKKDASLIEMLLKRGADVNMADANGWTPLIVAVQIKHVKMALLLLKYGADVTKTGADKQGLSPLHWAVNIESIELVQLLVESGADVTLKNHEGRTAGEVALENYTKNNDNESLQLICDFLMSLV